MVLKGLVVTVIKLLLVLHKDDKLLPILEVLAHSLEVLANEDVLQVERHAEFLGNGGQGAFAAEAEASRPSSA